jgi:nicotinamidase/pyrazinamidase
MTVVNEEQVAELVAAVLAGRQERIVETVLASEPAETRAAFVAVTEAIAAMGLTDEPMAPSAGLRERILASARARIEKPAHARKAILVIDMLNDHLSPGGPSEVPRARSIVPALAARLDAARGEGVPVVYVVDEHDPSDEDLSAVDGWGAHNVRGSEGAQVWPALAPKDRDRVVKKATYSAFTGSELADVLDELKVDTLVLTGCLTEIGVLATATEALQRGFAIEVPADAQAGANELTERVAMGVLAIMPPYGPARRARLEALGAR